MKQGRPKPIWNAQTNAVLTSESQKQRIGKAEETIVGPSGLMSLLEHFAHTTYLVKVLTFSLKFSYQLPGSFNYTFPFLLPHWYLENL